MARTKGIESTYGKTITIKHYVNTKIKPTVEMHGVVRDGISTSTTVHKYPLYVLINVKRQPTQFKSMLNIELASEQLERVLLTNAKEVAYEKKLITSLIMAAKPFDTSEFSLSSALKNYRILAQNYDLIVEQYLRRAIYEAIKQDAFGIVSEEELAQPPIWVDHGWDTHEKGKSGRTKWHEQKLNWGLGSGPFAEESGYDIGFWVNYLRKHIEAIQTLHEQYGPAIWNIKRYCDLVRAYSDLKFITIDDWNNGSFDNAFMSLYRDEATLQLLKAGVESLKSCSSELNDILSIVR